MHALMLIEKATNADSSIRATRNLVGRVVKSEK
jgi:hypothetical protein